MLLTLKIKNFALIADQTINFSKGFNVLVGETGSGKSLILDALAFVLGEKASKLNMRSGEDKMLVQAVFDDVSRDVSFLLEQNGIDEDDYLIITRTQNAEGKTECRINGVIVPVAVLKSVAPALVDAYAQNQNIELLNIKNHIDILDAYAFSEIEPLKLQIAKHLAVVDDINKQASFIGGNAVNRERELELLDYQIKEIENANLQVGEDDEIKSKLQVLSNFEKIVDNAKLASGRLSSLVELASEADGALSVAGNYDNGLLGLNDRLVSCKIELQDISETLNDYLTNVDFNQGEYEQLDSRLEEIKKLKKKYGATIEDVLLYYEKIKTDYDNLLFSEEKLAKLENQKNAELNELYTFSKQLSQIRRGVAQTIELEVDKELKMLGFKNAIFKVGFDEFPSFELANFSKHGLDQIEFLLSANAGESLKSLSKTISGGEMSRFMLALKNVFAKCSKPSTLVFDEVDTGISGEIGQRVAERLACLAKNSQLICITHLCQVSAMADCYIYVSKSVSEGKTFTKISYLKDFEIIKYIAVASGAEPTDVAIRFATELRDKAQKFKNTL